MSHLRSRDVVKAALADHGSVDAAAAHLCLPAEVVQEVADEVSAEQQAKDFVRRLLPSQH